MATFDPIEVLHAMPAECQRLIKAVMAKNDPMAPGVAAKLKDILGRYEADLSKYGLIPGYFAYALIHVWPAYARAQASQAQRPPSARDLFGPHSQN